MKIYFAGAISAGRERQPLYARMVEYLQACGMNVLSAHVAHDNVLHAEAQLTPQEIFTRDLRMIDECDAMVAEVSRPSLGVGFEIATALQRPRPVLCLCDKAVFLTRMLTGNTDPNLHIVFYAHEVEWQSAVSTFCNHLSKD